MSSSCAALSKNGCTFSGTTCSGTFQACGSYSSFETSCNAVAGCTWNGRSRSLVESFDELMDMRSRKLNVCNGAKDAVGIIILVAGIICLIVLLLAAAGAFYDFKAMNNPGSPGAAATTTVVQMGAVSAVPAKAVPVQGVPVQGVAVGSVAGAIAQPEAL